MNPIPAISRTNSKASIPPTTPSKATSGSGANKTTTPTTRATRTTTARTGTRVTGSASKTIPTTRTTTSKPTTSTPIRTSRVNSSASSNTGTAAITKAPSFSKSRSVTNLQSSRIAQPNRTTPGDRVRSTAVVRSKTPTLAPGFQSLTERKRSAPSSTTQSTRIRTTSGQGVGSLSAKSPNSSAKGTTVQPTTKSNTRSRSTEPLQSTRVTAASKSPGSSGISSSPAKPTVARSPANSLSPDKQRTGTVTKQPVVTRTRQTNTPSHTQSRQSANQIRNNTSVNSVSHGSSPVKNTLAVPVSSVGGAKKVSPARSPITSIPTSTRTPNKYTPVSRSKSVNATLPSSRLAKNVQNPITQTTTRKSSAGVPFKRSPIPPANQTKSTLVNSVQINPSPSADKSTLPAAPISITANDNDPFGIPLIAPTRPKEYDHRLRVRNKLPSRPTRGLIQQNATENHLDTLKLKATASCPNSPRSTPDLFPGGENPIQTKLDVKTFKFLLKPRDKDSLLMGAADRSPIYTSHEHVLIKVKGKRQVHARVTEPKVTSMNKGNAYIFISLTELWLWVGPDANPAETSKARSLANRIFKQKELGCKAIFLSEIDYREQNINTTRTHVLFNALEGAEKEIRASSSEDPDELYEKAMILATKVYEVVCLADGSYVASIIHENKYISVKTTLLQTDKVLIFDFGAEVYLWVGKGSAANPQMRKQGEKMAKDIFDNCYSAPSFDADLVFSKANSPTLNPNSLSLMTNRATGQKEQGLEGKATGLSSAGHTPKTGTPSPQRNPSDRQTNTPSTKVQNSPNRSKTATSTSATRRLPNSTSREKVTSVNKHLMVNSIPVGRTQSTRLTSTPPKKVVDRRTAVTLQVPNLTRAKSTARGTLTSENPSLLPNRPRSQEGNREDMCTPELKTPVYTKQARPAYCVLARMNEGAETVLFGDKFSDWKGALGIIKVAEPSSKKVIAAHVELMPCDTKVMLQERKVPPSIVDPVVVRLKTDNVKTVSLKKWLVKEYNNEFKHFEVNDDEFHIFYSKECYVYKWIYEHASLFPQRTNNLKTTSSTKERGMVFFWQGDECSINAKGAVAAISVEIDEEGNLHKERLPQGREDALFLQLFNGEMTVYAGKLDDHHDYDKLFFVRGSSPSESCVIEVPRDNRSLNSLGCYVYCCEAEQTVYAWRGASSSRAQNACLERAVEKMAVRKNFAVVNVNEGDGCGIFDKFPLKSTSIVSVTGDANVRPTPHLFELCGASGQFTSNQYIPQIYTNDPNPLIFLQLDLYSAQQPTIFMLDVYYEVYVWFGWWPIKTHSSRSHVTSESLTNTGVSDTRWQGDKKLAIQTAINYVRDAGRTDCPVYVAFAGSEPESFKDLFPFWSNKKDLNGVSRNDNPFHPQQKVKADDLLATYNRTRYTYAELTRKPLPEGVDPGKLEMYLSEQAFESIFNMKKLEFGKMPAWKQRLLRVEHNLY
eukprot:TRINITY_DN508_c0_g1_i4.p1 TRINITY_DN508_c0_g1~~TRINITY_DN508_c0_g1_i4.p1  ORF type:complete len:1458 (-),score=258.85 TRINITY_DN508_c0_g1_i4:143-4516(-)